MPVPLEGQRGSGGFPTAAEVEIALRNPITWARLVNSLYATHDARSVDAWLKIYGYQQSPTPGRVADTPTVGDGVSVPNPGTGGVLNGKSAEGLTRDELRLGLSSAGFTRLGFDVSDLINEAVRRKKSVSWLIGRIVRDNRFTNGRPGIVDGNGILVMAPEQYDNTRSSYREIGATYGVGLSDTQAGRLIAGNVSANEFERRAQATSTIRNNSQFLGNFNEILRARGEAPLTASGVWSFVLGEAPRRVYDIYEEASFSTAAEAAGLEITAGRANQLAARTVGVSDFADTEQRYSRIAAQLKAAGVELASFGIKQSDLEVIEFGGANRAELAAKAEQALKQREAALTTKVATQQTGTTKQGRPITQSSVEAGY